MRYLRLIGSLIRVSAQAEIAYPMNFFINLFYSLLNLLTSILGLLILFSQVQSVQGWNLPSSFALLGIYLILGALRGLVLGPSLDALAGLDGEIWTGRFDFTMLRPVNVQFLASLRLWRIFSCIDLLFGLGVLSIAIAQLGPILTSLHFLTFLLMLCIAIIVLYSILLIFAALVFWSPGFLFTWVFNSLFQMARYPLGLYPGWVRLILTWVIPVGIMTTIPAQALSGELSIGTLIASCILSVLLLIGASVLFQSGAKRYSSASS